MSLAIGAKLGPYEIVSLLGAGGMGEVYRALDTRLDRTVALKILPEQFARDPARRERFEREARLIASLSHPHICTLYDIGHESGVDFLVLEYLEGETLDRRLARGPLATNESLRYAIEVADALEKAHRRNIIHRDLKPGNIMLTKAGVKLLDFGLAKLVHAHATSAPPPLDSGERGEGKTGSPIASSPLTVAGTILGTSQYMSPEQLEGKEADARSDIFAFGVVLYEMATRRPAFTGKSEARLIAAIISAEPQPMTNLAPLTPPGLVRVVEVCLAKEPDERFQSAYDLKLQLNWIAEAGPATEEATPGVARRKGREVIVWALAAALLVSAALLTVAYTRLSTRPARSVRTYILPPEKSSFVFAGVHAGPIVVSPDGTRVAFVAATADGKLGLYVRPLDSIAAQPLPGTEGASFPFWSPDSRLLGFFADGKLKKIDTSGGPPVPLCDAPGGRGGTWGRDGTILFAPAPSGAIHRVGASGGTPSPVTRLDPSHEDMTHRWPNFLPDDHHFLFYVAAGLEQNSGVYLGSVTEGTRQLLLAADSNAVYSPPGYLLYVHKRALMAQPFDIRRLTLASDAFPVVEPVGTLPRFFYRGIFSASNTGVLVYSSATSAELRLVWYDRSGREQGTVGGPGEFQDLALSPDGKRLALSASDPQTRNIDVWVFDLSRGSKTRLTFDPSTNDIPVWSPDGARIAYASRRPGRFQIYEKAADGTGKDKPMVETPRSDTPSSWSMDGKYLAFVSAGPSHRSEIWVLPLFGERKPFAFLQSGFDQLDPMFSPDSKWLAYTSNDSGRDEVYVVPFPSSSGRWVVSTNGGSTPRWRRDGKEIYYQSPDSKIMAADVRVHGSSLGIGNVRPVFQPLAAARDRRAYDVTPDGRKAIVLAESEQGSRQPVTLVLNWTADLRR